MRNKKSEVSACNDTNQSTDISFFSMIYQFGNFLPEYDI